MLDIYLHQLFFSKLDPLLTARCLDLGGISNSKRKFSCLSIKCIFISWTKHTLEKAGKTIFLCISALWFISPPHFQNFIVLQNYIENMWQYRRIIKRRAGMEDSCLSKQLWRNKRQHVVGTIKKLVGYSSQNPWIFHFHHKELTLIYLLRRAE